MDLKYYNYIPQTTQGTLRKNQKTQTATRHHDNKSKGTSFFLIKMIVKLARTQSTAYQNKDQTLFPINDQQ